MIQGGFTTKYLYSPELFVLEESATMDKTIKDLKERRSVRMYANQEIPKNVIEDIVDCARLAPTANNQQPWHFVAIKEKKGLEYLAEVCTYGKFLKQANAAIVVFGDRENKHTIEDCSAAVENILVAAKAYEIGTCWIAGWKRTYNPDIEKFLNAPSNLEVVAIISLGYPEKESKAYSKKPLKDVLSWEEFK